MLSKKLFVVSLLTYELRPYKSISQLTYILQMRTLLS